MIIACVVPGVTTIPSAPTAATTSVTTGMSVAGSLIPVTGTIPGSTTTVTGVTAAVTGATAAVTGSSVVAATGEYLKNILDFLPFVRYLKERNFHGHKREIKFFL